MNNLMDLKKHLNKIRDILRTVGVTDSDSISHCIAFITLRRLTTTICKQTSVPETYAFKNFKVNLDDEELRNKFYIVTGECFVYYLRKKLGYDSFKFKIEIGNLHFRQIFTELEKINFKELHGLCDVVGTIYELHLSTGAKSSRDLGQYFTNRLVIKFMIDLVQPEIQDNGQIETIVDPTMGTGGFLSMAVEYLNKQGNVDWDKNKQRIFGYDIASQLKDMATINLLLETGKYFPNLQVRDTLSKDMCIDNKPTPYDIILANEPMGLKGLKYANFCDRIKELKINGTKAEPAFLQLFMQSLNVNGRCAVIVPDGVLFSTSKQHTETREYLINNYEVREIIKMNDKNFFMNTGVSASIIFFANPEERERDSIKFSEICLNKDQTEIIYKEVTKVNYETIAENDYSLNPNIYQQVKVEEVEGYEYKTLGEIFSKKRIKYCKTSDCNRSGKYPVISSATNIDYYLDTFECDEKCIVFNTINAVGKCNIHIVEKFNATSNTYIVQITDKNILIEYVYYILKNFDQELKSCYEGSTKKKLTISLLNNFKIPIPPLKKQQEIVEKMDVLSESNKSCQTLIGQLKKTFNIQMELFTRNCKEKKTLGEICQINPDNIKIGEFNNIRYIDLSSVNAGVIENIIDIPIDDAPSRAKRKVNIYDILLGTVRPNLQNNCYITDDIYSDNLIVSTGFCVLRCKDIINSKYLFHYLMTDKVKEELFLKATGSSYPAVNTTTVDKLTIPIPPLKKQKSIVKDIDSLMNLIQYIEKRTADNEHLMKNIIKN